MKKIVAYHLYNDFSGSPKVLKTVLHGLAVKGYAIDLVTSAGGVLDELAGQDGIRILTSSYRFSENALLTAVRFIWAQIKIFFISLRYLFARDVIFYINTIMPVGAALAGRLMRKKVVYHYHENADAKGRLYRSLASLMQKLADRIICVSDYQRSFLKRQDGVCVVPNALDRHFIDGVRPDSDRAFRSGTVLMLSSLKLYKGTLEFLELARMNPDFQFMIVINDTDEAINEFFARHDRTLPNNLKWVSRQSDVTSFYNSASIVLNLTDSSFAIETFGLTALEAMTAGLPVIVPTVGGIAEMVSDGYNGYRKDVCDLEEISGLISRILKDREHYNHLAKNALATSRSYSVENVMEQVEHIILT